MGRLVLLACLTALLGGCRSAPVVSPARVVGGDRDVHGCIGSAGYAWCPRTGRCERPWELAAEKSFELSQDAVARYCSGITP